MKPEIVRGHVCTWKITPTEDGQYEVTPGKKKYKDVETAKWAIRIAEIRYVNDHPDCPVANRDIWFDHGVLIISDMDGNYFESKSVGNDEDYYHIEFTYNGDEISPYIGTCKVLKKSVSNEKEALKKAKEYYDRNYPEYQAGFFKIVDKSYSNSTVIEAFDANKVKKRIARTDEFDNGYVIHDDYFNASSDEAEERAKQMSIDNPGKTFYVKYDDIMNPSSDKKWKDGKEITESAEAPNEMVDFINGLEWGEPNTKYGDEYDVVFANDWDPDHGKCFVLQIEKVDGTIPFYDTAYCPDDLDEIKKKAIEALGTKKVEEGRNTTGRYVWCEYQYVKDKTPDQLKAFAQMAFNNRYNANVKVTHFEKERYDNAEGHCEYVMYADGLHEDFDSFYFLVQCTKEEYEELPDSELYDAGGPARYYIDYFHWSHDRCWVTGYDSDLDKDFEITLCDGVGDEDRGRKKALEILKDNDINVSEDARNEMISTFGLEEKGDKGPGILSKEWLDKNVPDSTINEDDNDKYHQLVKELDEYLRNEKKIHVDELYFDPRRRYISCEIHNGDWKHEHLAFKIATEEFLDQKGYECSISSQEIGHSDSDCFSARYIIFIDEKSDSDGPIDLPLIKNESEGAGSQMIITIGSGVNADGCDIKVVDGEGNILHNEKYAYGYNASYSRKWASFYPDKPFIGDIVSDLCSQYSIDKDSIQYVKGKNAFKNTDASDKQISDFKSMMNEAKIETDPEKLASNVETTSEPQDDKTLADKIENEIINGDTFVGRKCIYTYKGLIGTPGYSCPEFDEEENDLHKLSGTEVEVVSGCPEYGYLIKSGNKEYYGVRAEELVLHDTNNYGAKEVSLKESDDRSNSNVVDCFTVNRTGMSFYDGFVDPDDKVNSRTTVSDYYKFEKGLSGRIVYMTADQYFKACSDHIFGTNLKRVKRGISQDKVDQYAEDLKNGKKYRLPFLDYAQKQQEGRHRMAAVEKAFGKDAKAPVLVVEVSEVSSEDIEDYAIRRWGEKNKDWGIEYVVGVRKNIENKYYLDKYNG